MAQPLTGSDLIDRIDAACQALEAAWQRSRVEASSHPKVQEFLPPAASGPARAQLLHYLLRTDYDCRKRRRLLQPLDAYLRAFSPEDADVIVAAVRGLFLPGQRLGPYELLEFLAEGGQGEVWRARQMNPQREVAVKLILGDLRQDREHARRFFEDAATLGRLHHAHIVQVYEAGESEGRLYFAMELLRGGSLAQRLRSGALGIAEAAELVETLARAMHAVHQQGILHRDLKPGNVLLTEQSLPKITDFGMAKHLAAGDQTRTEGGVCGTVPYMAPEQLRGRETDIRVDVYALGAILYETLTGLPPFPRPKVGDPARSTMSGTTQRPASQPADFQGLREQILEQEPVPPRQLRREVPRDLQTICLKCLQKDRERRYPSALHLAEDLMDYRAGRPLTHGRPVGRGERFVKWCRREPALALSLFALLLALAAAAGLAWQFRAKYLEAEANVRFAMAIARGQGSTYCRAGDLTRGLSCLAYAHEIAPLDSAAQRDDIVWEMAAHAARAPALKAYHRFADPATATATSSDGTRSAHRLADGRVVVCDAARPEPLRILSCSHVLQFGVTPEDALVLVDDSGRVSRCGFPWEGKVEDLASTFAGRFTRGALDLRGERAALVDAVGQVLHVLDLRTGAPLARQNLPMAHRVVALAFSGQGGILLAGHSDGTLRTWTLPRKIDAGRLPTPQVTRLASMRRELDAAHDRGTWTLDFSRVAAPTLALGGQELPSLPGTVQRLAMAGLLTPGDDDGGSTERLAVLQAAALNPEGTTVATAHADGRIVLWPVRSTGVAGQEIAEAGLGDVRALDFDPEGRRLLAHLAAGSPALWDVETGTRLPVKLAYGTLTSATFGIDFNHIWTCGQDGLARLWTVESGELFRRPLIAPATVLAAAWNGPQLLVGCADGSLLTWNPGAKLDQSRLVAKLGQPVLTAVVHSEGTTAWTTSTQREFAEVDLLQGKVTPLKLPAISDARAVALSPTGLAATGHDGGRTRIWDLTQRVLIQELQADPPSAIASVALSPDGRWLLTGTKAFGKGGAQVQLWDLSNGFAAWMSDSLPQTVRTLAFSPDGKAFAASNGRQIQLWSFESRQLRMSIESQAQVTTMALGHDAHLLFTGCQDGSVSIWDNGGRLLGSLGAEGKGVHALTLVSGQPAIFISAGDQAYLWTNRLTDLARARQLRLWIEVRTAARITSEHLIEDLTPLEWLNRRDLLRER